MFVWITAFLSIIVSLSTVDGSSLLCDSHNHEIQCHSSCYPEQFLDLALNFSVAIRVKIKVKVVLRHLICSTPCTSPDCQSKTFYDNDKDLAGPYYHASPAYQPSSTYPGRYKRSLKDDAKANANETSEDEESRASFKYIEAPTVKPRSQESGQRVQKDCYYKDEVYCHEVITLSNNGLRNATRIHIPSTVDKCGRTTAVVAIELYSELGLKIDIAMTLLVTLSIQVNIALSLVLQALLHLILQVLSTLGLDVNINASLVSGLLNGLSVRGISDMF
uniref:Gland-specifically expressed protein 2 n=1 Tax=Artemia parthenogenetica TaxID=6663 RepID=F8QRD9_ARTPA|nr:gland-specifically expressed protein 2 [Artemia parthenogenetica]